MGKERIIEEPVAEKNTCLQPGQTIDLSLSIKAIAIGTLDLRFQIQMEDEAGSVGEMQEIGLKVESKEA
jgi:translation elongation factor EF-1beta